MGNVDNFCADTSNIWRTIGYFLLVFKIVIPIILIILGMIDLGKAVVASDDKAISKSAKSLAIRIVAAVIIFFIPTIVGFIIQIVDTSLENRYDICADCISNPGGQDCTDAYNAEFGDAEDDTVENEG